MISEFALTPQVFEEIISSFDDNKSHLLVALTTALKKCHKNNIFVANVNAGRWKEAAIARSMQTIERQALQLQNAPTDDLSRGKLAYLRTLRDRLNDLWRQMDRPGTPEFMPFNRPLINEQDWLNVIFDSFNSQGQANPYPRPFCLITSHAKRGPFDRNNFENTIWWEGILEVLFNLNATVYDSRKCCNDYFIAIQKLLHFSSSIAVVTPFAVKWATWNRVSLTSEFEMILDLIRQKIKRYNYPHRLQKLVVIAQEDSKVAQNHPDQDRPAIRAEQKTHIENELNKRFTFPHEVHMSSATGPQKIVDRRLYFGEHVIGASAQDVFRWGVSVSHYFNSHDYGGVVALLSNDDVRSFMNSLSNYQ